MPTENPVPSEHPLPGATAQHLISLPPAMAEAFPELTGRAEPEWIADCDPPGGKLGSGGGVAHLLASSWQKSSQGASFERWLGESQKLLLMAGGQSRRLPAYAATGKLFLPIPVFRWDTGQHLRQNLLDLQPPGFRSILETAGSHFRVLMTSGDVLLRFDRTLPALPEVDVLGFGMWVRPEVAKHFGVFFSPREHPSQWAFFRQKPSTEEIRELAADYFYLVDTGMWLLSERAVGVLMKKCGWMAEGDFSSGRPDFYELYSDFGLSLGSKPSREDPEISPLSCAVVPLPGAEFYHLGTSRQMIDAVSTLQNLQLDQTKLGEVAARPHPDQYILNSDFQYPRRLDHNHTLWVENSCVPQSWNLSHDHVLTGIPPNDWQLRLEAGVCIDMIPVGENGLCLRSYGFDDPFRGTMDSEETLWCGIPAAEWFHRRGIALKDAGISGETDIQSAALFPIEEASAWEGEWIEWIVSREPGERPEFRKRWLEAERLSAEEIGLRVNLPRLFGQREQLLAKALPSLARNHKWNPFYRLDLEETARLFVENGVPEPEPLPKDGTSPLTRIRDAMFRSALTRLAGKPGFESQEDAAFRELSSVIVSVAQTDPVLPTRTVLEDQILWGRAPVRIDLAGGWSDTPPYCLSFGGKVVNMAVNLNGQPPIQVFAKAGNEPCIVLRSIDLGIEKRITTYEELDGFAAPGGEFSLAKAALALVGFLPRFHANGGHGSLREHLEKFGGGIEVSLLAAVPTGSGLGTSSILSATLLAVLADFCGLGWDQDTISSRTLALEQMLTTGGGWQDQVGGLTRGVKLVETSPGLEQNPSIKWLPEYLFDNAIANRTALLYYTGVTRLAKNILYEIVRGMFLNRASHLEILHRISEHGASAYEMLQKEDPDGIARCVRTAWELKQELDSGTNPPEIQKILARIEPWVAGCKLPGAGGGGYLFLIAKDPEAAAKIREELTTNPPNPRARFVDWDVSRLGLQVTRS